MHASHCRISYHDDVYRSKILRQQGFSLLELLIAASILLIAVSSSLVAMTSSSRLLDRSEKLSGVLNQQRVAQSYLRGLSFATLRNATESTLTAGINYQLTPADWSRLGATASCAVTGLAISPRLITVDLQVMYDTNRLATTSLRFAQGGVNP